MFPKSNPKDRPDPPPLPRLTTPSVRNEAGSQRLDPAEAESAALNRRADKLTEVALARVDPAAPPASRALAKATFDEIKTLRAAARLATIVEQQRAAALTRAQAGTDRDAGSRRRR